MLSSKHLAKPVRKTWKNQPASSLDKISTFERCDSNKTSDNDDSVLSLSSTNGWIIKYRTIPKPTRPQGVWDGYQTKEEFALMHLR
ncbi:unnamed protein product [Adineta ricciae]|uniref:Uncharacterized protein n=1 Tax=Adineta ricciae TaxID=249248 RepID=A0A814A5Z8_ADIRI|nr:unnamed protein product [Adineta ricciae]